MKEDSRWGMAPQQYIRNLFAATKDGKVEITIYPENGEDSYVVCREVDWNESDMEHLIQHFETLLPMLNRFGKMAKELEDDSKREKILSSEELIAWDIYARPLKPFEVDADVINEIYFRGEYDQLSDEECDLLERHYEWQEAQFLQRLPFHRCSPRDVIIRAKRYSRLVYWDAPEIISNEEARLLAEEMVLYYHGKRKENADEN